MTAPEGPPAGPDPTHCGEESPHPGAGGTTPQLYSLEVGRPLARHVDRRTPLHPSGSQTLYRTPRRPGCRRQPTPPRRHGPSSSRSAHGQAHDRRRAVGTRPKSASCCDTTARIASSPGPRRRTAPPISSSQPLVEGPTATGWRRFQSAGRTKVADGQSPGLAKRIKGQ